jgi:hypothetical protein
MVKVMSPAIVSVFICSSSLDLSEERETIQLTLRNMREGNFLGRDYFGGQERRKRNSLDEVEKSQVFLLILGGICGSGIVEEEYRRACERHIPRFVYFKETEPRETDAGNLERLAALKQEIEQTHPVTRFSTPDELARAIRADLHRWYFNQQLTYSCATNAIGSIDILHDGQAHRLEIGSAHGAILYARQDEVPAPQATVSVPDLPFSRGLVGREDEIGFARYALENGTPAMFSGASGIGKSAMMLELAVQHQSNRALSERFPDGIVLIPSVGNRKSDDVLQIIFQSFYPTETPLKCIAAERDALLGDKRALILLDDVEMEDKEIVRLMRILPDSAFAFASNESRLEGIALQIDLVGLAPEKAIALFSREIGRRLNVEELMTIDMLCVALEGNPQQILMVAALVRENPSHLLEIGSKSAQQEIKQTIAALTLSSLTAHEKKVLAALGAGNGGTLSPDTISLLTAVPGIAPILESLCRRKLVENFGNRYYLPKTLKEYLSQIWDLSDWYEFEIRHFLTWVESHRLKPARVQPEWETIFAMPDWQRAAGRSTEVVQLGRALDPSLALGGQWNLWDETLQKALQAAQEAEDRESEAWALHQLGTRAMCNGERLTARYLLAEALELRVSLQDHLGAAVTQHNLDMLQTLPAGAPVEKPAETQEAPIELQFWPEEEEASSPSPVSDQPPAKQPRLAAFQQWLPRLVPIGTIALVLIVTALTVSFFFKGRAARMKAPATFAPNWISVTGQQIYTESVPYTVTFTNEQANPVTIDQLAIDGEAAGDFKIIGNDCLNRAIDPKQECRISVVFAPTIAGARAAALFVQTSAGQRIAELKLTGTAIEEFVADGILASIPAATPAPSPTPPPTPGASGLSVTPSLLTFESVEAGKTSRALVAIKNESAGVATLSGIMLIGANADDFRLDNTCNQRLEPGKSCVLRLEFSPRQPGPREAALLISTSNNTASQYVALKGSSLSMAARLEAIPGKIDFGLAVSKTASSQQIVTIKNTGQSVGTIQSVSLADDSTFSLNDVNCRGRAVNPGDSCSLSLTFKPKNDGDYSTALVVQSSAQNNPLNIPVEGRVQLILSKTPSLVIYPNSLRLSYTGVPATDRKLSRGLIRLANQGQTPFTIKDVLLDGPEAASFRLTHKCKGATIAPEESCDIEVVLEPTAGNATERRARLLANINGSSTPQSIVLTGTLNLQR